jgi:putative transposase
MIEQLKTEYPIQVICDVIGYSRSQYYYQPNEAKQEKEKALKKAMA